MTLKKSLAIALLSALPLMTAQAQEFSAQQKQAIERIIRDYLLNNPELLVEMSRKLQERQEMQRQQQVQAALKAHGPLIFAAPHDPVAGNPQGSKVLVEFFDYNCPYCKRAFKNLQKLMEEDKELKVVFKELPILGPGSLEASQVALALHRQDPQKYWKLHQQLYEYPGRVDGKVALALAERLGADMDRLEKDMKSEEVMKILSINNQLANVLGIEGTPAFVVNGKVVRGAVPIDELKAAIEGAAGKKKTEKEKEG